MQMVLFGLFTLIALIALPFAALWTFSWMPAAFENTDPAIHHQVRWGYVHGAVIALVGLAAAAAAWGLRPKKKEA